MTSMTDPWTPLKLLAWSQEWFAKKGIDAPRLTGELLLSHALGCDRIRLYLDFDKPLGEPEPTAYLVGRREFYGRPFRVSPAVLVPRPETELVVEAALAALPEGGSALDLCAGSGAIAVSLALEKPGARVLATELSPDALRVARENVAALGAAVELLEGDLFAPLPAGARFDVVVSNPPYVPSGELPGLSREVRREPALALDGGPDGLALLRRIVAEAPRWLAPGGAMLLEMHESHAEPLVSLCRAAGFSSAEPRKDLAGLWRFVVARL